MQTIDRRRLLTNSAIGAAAVSLGVGSTLASTSDDAELMELWQRFIAAEVHFASAVAAEDAADYRARREHHALICPWTPLGSDHWETGEVEISRGPNVIEVVQTKTTVWQNGVGPWLVKEYQPSGEHHPYTQYRDGCPIRWQPYPEAETADDAYAMAKARTDKEWRSFEARRGAISRKHEVRNFKAEAKAANEACRALRYEIAVAPVTGVLSLALKLGVRVYDQEMDRKPPEPDQSDCFDEMADAATMSIYRHAVAECGFDPVAVVRLAVRRRDKAEAKRAMEA